MERELQSCKEIAAYLGITIRTAQNWEQERGLPVHRLPGPRGRVFALAEELDAWKQQQHELPAPEPLAPQPSDPPEQRPIPGGRLRQHWRWIAAAALLAVSVSAPALYTRGRTKNPVTFSIRGNAFLAISASGEVLWQKTFPALLHQPTPPATPPFTSVVAVDLDGDGHTEVLFNPVFENPGPLELICWNADGTERWRYAVRREVRSSEQTFEPLYWIERFVPLASSGARASPVLVVANHHQLYPSQVALLSAEGVLQGEYWHPGRLHEIDRMDLDQDGSAEILLGGISNGETAATVVVLDPGRMNGRPKVSKFPRKALLDLPQAQEVARILFPRSRNRRDATDPWAIEKSKLGPVEVIRPGNSSASPRTSSGTSPASD